jgi:hypothetical protein
MQSFPRIISDLMENKQKIEMNDLQVLDGLKVKP